MDEHHTPDADYDSPWKEALARYLPEALALFFPVVYAAIDWKRGYTLLDKELQQVTRDADLGRRLVDTLVQVWRRDGTDAWVLIHIEVQGTPEHAFARRMFVYYYRIFDRYEHPIMSVAILGDEQPDWRPARFEQEVWGCAVQMRYPVVKLLDWRAREGELTASDNPFAVVVRAYLVAQATRGAIADRHQAKVALIRGLYERGYGREQIVELFRLIDWFVALPPEHEDSVWREIARIEEERTMPYITSIERIGMREGQIAGQRALLLRLVRARFGQVPEAIEAQLAQADQEALERFADRLATATTLDDLRDET